MTTEPEGYVYYPGQSLDRIEVLMFDTKGVKVRKGKMQTMTKLTLEQTQQGISDEVLVSIERVEDLKRNVKIKVKRKKPSLHLGRNRVNTYAIRNTKLLSGIEDSHHGPSDAMHNPSQPLKVSQNNLVSFLTEIKHISVDSLTPNQSYGGDASVPDELKSMPHAHT
ncbi:hypothetical protein Tco_1211586 [Tanacetum coccineum]